MALQLVMICFNMIFQLIISFINIHLTNMTNTTQKSLILTICKIFNWEDTQSSTHFQVFIYSTKSSTLLLSKRIKAVFSRNQAIFKYSFRVHYPTDENQIRIKLSNLTKITNTMYNLAEFNLNLDNLISKKMQFFPFGKNDKVLKIAIGEQQRLDVVQKTCFNQQNYNFIQQKEEFLNKISNHSSTSRLNGNSTPTKTFSERAKNLLSQKKYKRHQGFTQRNEKEQEFINYYQNYNQSDYLKINLKQVKRVNKSNSQRVFLSHKTGRIDPYKFKSEEEYQRRSNKSLKHKLALKSLEMVACQNQYYLETEYNDGDRRASVIPQNKISVMKRIIKSQLY